MAEKNEGEKLLEVISSFSNGASIRELLAAFGDRFPRRTLQRHLKELILERKIEMEGGR